MVTMVVKAVWANTVMLTVLAISAVLAVALGFTGLSGGPGMLGPVNGLKGANGMLGLIGEQSLIGGGSMPLSSAPGAGGLGALGIGMLAAAGAQDRLGPGLDPLLAPDSVDFPLGVVGGGVPPMMGVPAGLGAIAGGGPADLGGLSTGAPAMLNSGDLGALGACMPMMAGAVDVSGIIASLQDALRGIATGFRGVA
ncbi:hypothetical protein EC957_000904 [Mortierella hygrophila]|uniref:Uncharacterized protein n=1 Tax=Mortierella hygrophila TaxID=979708 RepID=A0A9P6F5F9_9FUNG|nr:hypothetical protein EC957_000904 [Mortierella hygrophila]